GARPARAGELAGTAARSARGARVPRVRSLPLVVSALAAAAVAGPVLRALADGGVTHENYRGARLPYSAGTIVVVAAALALIPLAALDELAGADIFEPRV